MSGGDRADQYQRTDPVRVHGGEGEADAGAQEVSDDGQISQVGLRAECVEHAPVVDQRVFDIQRRGTSEAGQVRGDHLDVRPHTGQRKQATVVGAQAVQQQHPCGSAIPARFLHRGGSGRPPVRQSRGADHGGQLGHDQLNCTDPQPHVSTEPTTAAFAASTATAVSTGIQRSARNSAPQRCLCAGTLAIRREIGDEHGEATTLRRLGDVHIARQEPTEAQRCWRLALRLFDALRAHEASTLREQLADSNTLGSGARTR